MARSSPAWPPLAPRIPWSRCSGRRAVCLRTATRVAPGARDTTSTVPPEVTTTEDNMHTSWAAAGHTAPPRCSPGRTPPISSVTLSAIRLVFLVISGVVPLVGAAAAPAGASARTSSGCRDGRACMGALDNGHGRRLLGPTFGSGWRGHCCSQPQDTVDLDGQHAAASTWARPAAARAAWPRGVAQLGQALAVSACCIMCREHWL